MPFNLIKKYPEFLELAHLSESERTKSLSAIFNRDIVDNTSFSFMTKTIWPLKSDTSGTSALFIHLTCEDVKEENPDGSSYSKRYFEIERSIRLHWIKGHIDEAITSDIEVFSISERDIKKRKDVVKTYIYNREKKYIIVLLPQRTGKDYYLLTAYSLNRKEGLKAIEKKLKNKLTEIS